jgi:hypothetical protein
MKLHVVNIKDCILKVWHLLRGKTEQYNKPNNNYLKGEFILYTTTTKVMWKPISLMKKFCMKLFFPILSNFLDFFANFAQKYWNELNYFLWDSVSVPRLAFNPWSSCLSLLRVLGLQACTTRSSFCTALY